MSCPPDRIAAAWMSTAGTMFLGIGVALPETASALAFLSRFLDD